MTLTRRELIRVLGGAASLWALRGCGDNRPPPGPFTAAQRTALAAFADVIIPPDARDFGASKLGAIEYIETLLAAFDQDPPAIFGGGPYSGRTPFTDGTSPENSFALFVELDRVADRAWRLEVLGGTGVNGETIDPLFARIASGLDLAIAAHGDRLDLLGPDKLSPIFDKLPETWRSLMLDLVTEAVFSAPEYGGNAYLLGWRLAHFEGDQQPRGYTDLEVSGPNTAPDPDPLDDEVETLLALVTNVLGGKVAS